MLSLRRALVAVAACVAWSCADATSIEDPSSPLDLGALGPSLSVIPELPAVCGVPTVVTLIADETVPVGSVEVSNDEASLYVVYETDAGWPIRGTALFVGTSVAEIPTSGGGNPQPGQFPHKDKHDFLSKVVYEIPLAGLAASELVVAAFAQVDSRKAGAWGDGDMINPGGNWATYFMHTVVDCAAETVDADGGVVETSSQDVQLDIPEGALDEPVVITIDPATVDDLLGSAGNADRRVSFTVDGEDASGSFEPVSAAAVLELPAVQGIIPIEGTIWEFKPNGQQFKKPIKVSIRYLEEKLPVGFDESRLGIFILNGIFEGPPSTVDVQRNRVEAEMEHFSYAFVGYAEASADLLVSAVSESGDPIELGQSIMLGATVDNLGPTTVEDAVAYYRIDGNVVAGPLPAGCTETASPAESDVEIVCGVGTVDGANGSAAAPTATFTPQEAGVFSYWVVPGSSVEDPDASNDRFDGTFAVTAEADLQVTRVEGTPDPVAAGGSVTFEVDVVATGAAFDVFGAQLEVLFTGDAVFQSSATGCVAAAGGVSCALPTLQPDVTHTASFVMALPTAGQVVTADATVTPPADVSDTDASNDTGSDDVTVEAAAFSGMIWEDVLPAGGDTARYYFEGAAGQTIRIHLALQAGATGFAQLALEGPGGVDLFPEGVPTALGRATNRSSANAIEMLAVDGTYQLKVGSGGSGPYRLGLGTGQGRLDGTFGTEGTGRVVAPDNTCSGTCLRKMTMLGDDFLVMGDRRLRRYTSAGLPDATFGTNGVVDLDALMMGDATDMVIQPDGKIVVVAAQYLSPYEWAIARYNADGSVDAGFGTAGLTTVRPTSPSSSGSRPAGVRFQQNGADLDIIVAGATGANLGNLNNLGLVRLNPDGSLDGSFGSGGIIAQPASGLSGVLMKMDVQSDGSIVIADGDDVRRYTPAGALDASFGTAGIFASPASGSIQAIQVLPDDRILAIGEQLGDAYVFRTTAAGALDATFAGGGFQTYDFGLPDRFQGITRDALGNLIVVGRQLTVSLDDREFLVTRMTADGVLDAQFGHLGYTLEHIVDDAWAVGVDTQGRIVVGGNGRDNFYGLMITRHLPF